MNFFPNMQQTMLSFLLGKNNNICKMIVER